MNRRFKVWLIALLVLVGQSFAMGEVIAHTADPDHDTHDCAVCLTVQINDTAPPPVDSGFNAPQQIYWLVSDVESQDAVLKALSDGIKTRAPPQ